MSPFDNHYHKNIYIINHLINISEDLITTSIYWNTSMPPPIREN